MDSAYGSYLLQQFIYHLPFVLAGLIGTILSLMFWSRCRGPAIITLIASIIILLLGIVIPVSLAYLLSARVAQGWPEKTFGFWTATVSLCGAVIRGFAILALMIAVFIGRRGRSDQLISGGVGDPSISAEDHG